MDLQQQQTDLQDILTVRTSGAPFPGPWMRVESIISQRRDMKIKSTFNISFQIHFVCSVLNIFIVSWILLIVAFNLLTPWCSFLQKGRLMKLCDGDCTIKKEIGNNVSFSSIFLEVTINILGSYCTSSEGICSARSRTSHRVTVLHYLILKNALLNAMFASLYYTPPRWNAGFSVVMKQWVRHLHFIRHTETTDSANTKKGRLYATS